MKSKEDFIKIPDPKLKDEKGTPRTIGILNINNMIPVSDNVISKLDLSSNSKLSKSAKQLLFNELKWCRDNVSVISNRANKLYKKVTLTPEKDRNLTRRCCDFKKLESVLEKWLSKKQDITADKSTIPVKKGKSKAPTTSRSTLHKIARKVSQESPQEPPKGKKRSHDIE